MKKIYLFSIVTILVIILVSYAILHPRDYSLSYEKDNYHIVESYNKKDKIFFFKINKDENEYFYASRGKYSISRKIVSKVENEDSCITLFVKDYNMGTECIKDGKIVGKNILEKDSKPEKINTISGFDIYDDSHKYYAWDSYGVMDILNRMEYSYLKTETYNNSLFYMKDNFLIFPDYDAKRNFKTFYIFDTNKNDYFEILSEDEISFDSYFMGDVKNSTYLFDKKNKVQYEINLKKKIISKVSDKDSIKFYDNGWTERRLDDFVYNETEFDYDNTYNFVVENSKLYMTIKGYEQKILISNRKVKDIIKVSNNKVFYLVDTALYEFNLVDGERKLIEYFEWNFSYLNKIFIID